MQKYFDENEAAELLSISPRTLKRYANDLKVGKVKLPKDRKYYYTLEALRVIKAELDKKFPHVVRPNFQIAA